MNQTKTKLNLPQVKGSIGAPMGRGAESQPLDLKGRNTGTTSDPSAPPGRSRGESRYELRQPLRVMKFGGTSVGDSSCIQRVIEIVRAASRESRVLVVVSAMSGVTNKLIEAANQSKAGNEKAVSAIFTQLRAQHDEVVRTLVHSHAQRQHVENKLRACFEEGERLCRGTILLRELTPRTLDAISGLGERLSVPLVAAALSELGVRSEGIEATELVVTDSYHGGAEPWIDLTRTRCEARVLPLLQKGIVPVVTGFIGATEDGVLTTLGRGGSDYSATILGAALHADEVVIWSDVPGLLTADPRLVPEARTIAEISYREAAELAYFGAKVLHPKTLRPVVQSGIPLRIRNTFSPDQAGTKITPQGPTRTGGVRALTTVSDAALITVAGPGIVGVSDVLARTVATAAAVRADLLLVSQSSSQNDLCLVVPSAMAKRTVEALRHEFSQDLMHEKVEHILDSAVAIVTLVGQNMRGMSEVVVRTFGVLAQANVNIIATVQGSSDCNMSFVVPQSDMRTALAAIHRELRLDLTHLQARPVQDAHSGSPNWDYGSGQASAD